MTYGQVYVYIHTYMHVHNLDCGLPQGSDLNENDMYVDFLWWEHVSDTDISGSQSPPDWMADNKPNEQLMIELK